MTSLEHFDPNIIASVPPNVMSGPGGNSAARGLSYGEYNSTAEIWNIGAAKWR